MTASANPLIKPYLVGDIEVWTIPDGSRTFPLPEGFVSNASREQINAALSVAGMPPDEMTIVFNPVVLRQGENLILIDTGNGEAANQTPNGPGLSRKNVAAAGMAPEKIGRVIITHFHGDHINGLLLADGGLAYPNATISVPQPEWDFWTSEDEIARAKGSPREAAFANVQRVLNPLRDRIEFFAWDEDIVPGVKAVGTPGHTPGHTSLLVSSGKERLFIQGDVTNRPELFVPNPGWHLAFDMDPDMAEATRRKVYTMLADERLVVQGFHYPAPSRALIEKDGEAFKLVWLE